MKKNSGTGLAITALVLVIVIGAVYWLAGGVDASKGLTKHLLTNYKYLGAVLTLALIVVIGVALNRQQKT